jgi:nicotinamide-nucleotide amidase
VVRSRVLRTTGVAEAALAEQLGEIERDIAPLSLAYLPDVAGVDLRITAWQLPAGQADALLERGAARIRSHAGDAVYGEGTDDLAAVVLEAARRRGLRIVVAESCTGGLVGGRLTDTPGSSDVVESGVVCYSYESKTRLLGVPADLVVAHGAVSETVAQTMAEGALERLGGDLSVAVTGIAGPGGGTPEKPVGTVWFATAMAGDVRATRIVFFGTRAEVRARAAQTALRLLLGRLRER